MCCAFIYFEVNVLEIRFFQYFMGTPLFYFPNYRYFLQPWNLPSKNHTNFVCPTWKLHKWFYHNNRGSKNKPQNSIYCLFFTWCLADCLRSKMALSMWQHCKIAHHKMPNGPEKWENVVWMGDATQTLGFFWV